MFDDYDFSGTFFEVLSSDPLIVAHAEYNRDALDQLLPPERVIRLVNYAWHRSASRIVGFERGIIDRRPQDEVVHLINEWAIAEELKLYDVRSLFMPSYIFLDETVFHSAKRRSCSGI